MQAPVASTSSEPVLSKRHRAKSLVMLGPTAALNNEVRVHMLLDKRYVCEILDQFEHKKNLWIYGARGTTTFGIRGIVLAGGHSGVRKARRYLKYHMVERGKDLTNGDIEHIQNTCKGLYTFVIIGVERDRVLDFSVPDANPIMYLGTGPDIELVRDALRQVENYGSMHFATGNEPYRGPRNPKNKWDHLIEKLHP